MDASDAVFGTILAMAAGGFLALVLLKQRKAAIEQGLDWSTTWGWILPYKFPMATLGLFWILLALVFREWAILGLVLGIPVGILVIRVLNIDVTPDTDGREHQPRNIPMPNDYEGD